MMCCVGLAWQHCNFLQDKNGVIIGAQVKDNLTGKQTQVYAKQVINATGPFTDSLRKMSDPSKPSIIMPSAGMHGHSCTAATSILLANEVCVHPQTPRLPLPNGSIALQTLDAGDKGSVALQPLFACNKGQCCPSGSGGL